MLLAYTFENISCFKNESRLSLVASSDKQHPSHISQIDRPGAPKVLRTAAIYGANAHGKTKIVDAFLFLKAKATGVPANPDYISTPKFKLDNSSAKSPSKMQVAYRVGTTDYEYGLIVNDKEIIQEWLFEVEKRQEVLLFSREKILDKRKKDKYKFEFGAKLRESSSPSSKINMVDYLTFIGASLDNETSFLSEAFDKKVKRLKKPIGWFRETLQIITASSSYSSLHDEVAKNDEFRTHLSRALAEADTGIGNILVKERNLPDTFLETLVEGSAGERSSLGNEIASLEQDEAVSYGNEDGALAVIRRDKDGFKFIEFVTSHTGVDGEVEFSLSEESSGTRRLMDLDPLLFQIAQKGGVYVVDELDRKLHPLLAYRFIEKFLSLSSGQLIFTTHTAHLLDLDLLRRDEIWIVQKKDDGSSDLYSLADFKVRPDLDIRKGYLQGRFGGVPFFGDPTRLGWCSNGD